LVVVLARKMRSWFFCLSARFSCCTLRRRGATYVREGSTSVKDKGDMAQAPKPIRRVVTGNDAQGRSRVLFDSAAPNVNPGAIVRGTCMTDIWVYQHSPAPISGDRDDGSLPFHFEPPAAGGHLRIVQSPGKPRGYDPARDPAAVPLHPPRRRTDGVWDRGGQNAFSSPIHKSETVDYGFVLSGERVLVLDSGQIVMKPGDVVVQLGNWHGWTNPSAQSLMAFVMMGAKFEQ
jgi:mannose-6-phosphate isomerase-like protein (cupin superfamily)